MEREIVSFDWNGFLLDDRKLVYAAVRAIFSHFGKTPPSEEDWRRKITTKNWIRTVFYDNGIPPSVSRQELNSLRINFFQTHRNGTFLAEGALSALKRLKAMGCRLIIVSGEAKDYLVNGDRLQDFGLLDFFEIVEDGVTDKSEVFKELIKHFNVSPRNFFHGDDQVDGIEAAKRAGVQSIGLLDNSQSYHFIAEVHRAKPDHFISHLGQIPQIIELERRWRTCL